MNGLTEGKFVIKCLWVLFKNLNFWVLTVNQIRQVYSHDGYITSYVKTNEQK